MKKIILCLTILFFICGCYDYQELQDRAIISGIAIDYLNEEFIINYEILNTEKSDSSKSEENPNKAYLIEGKGITVTEAFQNAADKVSKDIHLSHLKLLILSESAAEKHMRDIADYLLRDPNVRNIFSLVVARNNTAKSILENTSMESPVVSESIDSLIRHNKYNENISIEIDFDHFMDRFEDPRIDTAISAIELIDGKITLNGMAIFENGKLKSILDSTDAAIYKIIENTSQNHRLQIPCEDTEGFTIINLYQNNHTDVKVTQNAITIQSKLNASVLKDSCGYNFRDSAIYKDLETKFQTKLEQEIKDFYTDITFFNTDILGIQKKYYQTTRKELEHWNTLELKTDIQIEINKNGLIFEVKKK